MLDEFCSYCKIGAYNSFCICELNKQMCGFVRRCSNELRYKPLASMSNCELRKGVQNMTNVRFEKNGKLYVDYKDITVIVPNIYGKNIPSWVDIIEINDKFYIKGQEPKILRKK